MAVEERTCPRCLRTYGLIMFQEPVRICMVCYALNRGNSGLNLFQLKQKASRSRFARSANRHVTQDRMFAYLMGAKDRLNEECAKVLAKEVHNCDRCHKTFPESQLKYFDIPNREMGELVCESCLFATAKPGSA